MPKGVYIRTETHLKNMSSSRVNRLLTEDHKRNIRETTNKKEYVEKARQRTLNSFKDSTRKECHKKTMKEVMSNPKVILNCRNAHLGVKLSEKHKKSLKLYHNKTETKEKRAIALLRGITEGRIKSKFFNTKPELKVFASYIAKGYKEGTDIIKQYHCKGVGLVDFYLPKENTLIFVDGDYWHCNPEKYKPCFYQQQSSLFAKQVWDRDNNITNKCKELGYNVVRVWESNINKEVMING